ncbi:MAG: ISLre2 family transposase [Peptostreptococcales bacterium]
MLEKILSEKEINFNKLEKEIFKIGCEYAQRLMVNIFKMIDDELANNRDKRIFRHKGKRKTTLKTLMGEVEFERNIYETRSLEGEKAFVYLLDRVMDFKTFGKISTNLAHKISENACICSFRNSAKNITELTGQSISHGGVWNVVQSLGAKIKETENEYSELAANGEIYGQKETKVLFEEADGVWINIQGKDRPKKGRKLEMKVAVAYDGWEKHGKNRYELRNKIAVAGYDRSKEFQKRKEGIISSMFNTDEIAMRILNGDGGSWIKAGLIDDTVHYQLDPFHLNREIIRTVKDKEQKDAIMKMLSEKRIEDVLIYIKAIEVITEDNERKAKLEKLYQYLSNNKEGLIPYKERGIKLPSPPEGVEYRQLGTMEHHICDIIAQRMKHRKTSWSISGSEKLGKILTQKVCKTLYEKITQLSKIILPEEYTREIKEVISAAKMPLQTGKGYKYPITGKIPFEETYVTNGRDVIQSMLKDRKAIDLVYR